MQSEEPTIIQSLEEHLKECGHTTVGQDIAAAILVIKDLHQKAALSAAKPVDYQLVFSDGRTSRVLYSKDEADRFKKASDITVDIRALYAAPPAPSVAVKALLDDVWNAAVERAAVIANDSVHLTPDPGAAIKTMLNGRATLHPPSEAALSAQVQDVATHRHKKRGTQYVLIGVGKMQVENWCEFTTEVNHAEGREYAFAGKAVDMREVAIYRSVDDGSLWVRPVEEFNDGRFEPLPAAPAKQES